jgi:hypothetical protein
LGLLGTSSSFQLGLTLRGDTLTELDDASDTSAYVLAPVCGQFGMV